jgi:hypothetical protein
MPGWPDFGLTRLQNKERRRKPVRAILAGQPADAQVSGVRVTVYGSEDQHDHCSRRLARPRPACAQYLRNTRSTIDLLDEPDDMALCSTEGRKLVPPSPIDLVS